MVNVNRFKAKVVENGLKMPDVASHLKIDTSTLYRKLSANGDTFTVREVKNLGAILKLSRKELMDIFFGEVVA